MDEGSLTFRLLRALAAGALVAARWLILLVAVVAVGLPLMRVAAGWYARGTFDLTPPAENASPAGMSALAVRGGTAREVAAVRSAAASLRYRVDPRAVSVVVMDRDPLDVGAQGEFLPYLDLIRVKRSVIDLGGMPLRWTLAHEIGHYVDTRFMTDPARRRFMALRHIPPSLSWRAPALEWRQRPDEDFAEVFAALSVPSPLTPPSTVYGRVSDPAAIVGLLRGVGVRFGAGPPPTGWREALAREYELLRDTVSEPATLLPLLVLVVLYLALGALPAAANAWRASGDSEGVPRERPLDTRARRVLNTPRLATHTGRRRYVTHENRRDGSGG
ncbi:MAG TPA: hypothetical protein VGK50_08470 [Coriobacteriia bacterium]|jgi:hypothetical protein